MAGGIKECWGVEFGKDRTESMAVRMLRKKFHRTLVYFDLKKLALTKTKVIVAAKEEQKFSLHEQPGNSVLREGATVAFTYVKGEEEKDAYDTLKKIQELKGPDAKDHVALPADI
ncbi:unnamed protein product [Fraxinus pennsylvanica]|uniref:Uncharacterized protein n=1 Tax=Fraxinus pennsylvanica TaxID=56036 RepID=A0AAD1ZKE0_9LAMI|nr:unnamed protein product [Fraxinus pennsylvanica]